MNWSSERARQYWNRRVQERDAWSAVLDQSQPIYVNRGYHRWLSRCITPYLVKGGQVLDVGCGLGRNFALLVEGGMKVHGLDLAEHMLRRALDQAVIADKAAPPVLLQGLADRLPYRSGKFDLVVCTELLFHLPREALQGALSELSRVLRMGGCCLVTINNSRSVALRGMQTANAQDNEGYLCNILSSSLIIELAANVGLLAKRQCYRIATSFLDIVTMLPVVRPVGVRLRGRGAPPYVWMYQAAVLMDRMLGQFKWLGERMSSLVFIEFKKS